MQALSPCNIGKCEIRNRFVMTAANLGWCEDGCVTEKIIDFYRERAKGGVGLLIAGAAGVDPVRVNDTGMMQIYDDRFLPPFQKLCREVHSEGSRIFLQLMHAGAYARQDEHGGKKAVGPSVYRCNFTREEPEALSEEGIRQVAVWFGEAAARAKRAGFDGVELIGSAGYLIAEFLSAATNRREDAYGGDISGRTRFLLDVIREVRERVGAEYPVMVRLSGTDFIPGGNGPAEAVAVAKRIADQVDAIDVTGGWHESGVPQITYNVPHGMYLYLAKAIRDAVNVPVVGCNRMDPAAAEYALCHGCADMVGMLRELIADPFLVRKCEEGRQDAIRPCLACNQECLESIFSGGGVGCVVNPRVGHEGEPLPGGTREAKRILVIGAGVAGMAFAAMADAEVTVWERTFRYGGAANAVARLPGREDVKEYVDYLFRQCVKKGVRFVWNREGSPEELSRLLSEKTFDRIVIAAGAGFRKPEIAAAEDAPVCRAEECILSDAPKGREIVVIGSGYKAVQTAQYLALAKKRGDGEALFLKSHAPEYGTFANNVMGWESPKVTLLASAKKAGGGFGKSTRFMMLNEIKQLGIRVETEADVREIRGDRVVWFSGEEKKETPADMAVIAEGYTPSDGPLAAWAKTCGDVQILGDAKRPGRISEAVKDAWEAAMILKEVHDV